MNTELTFGNSRTINIKEIIHLYIQTGDIIDFTTVIWFQKIGDIVNLLRIQTGEGKLFSHVFQIFTGKMIFRDEEFVPLLCISR